MTWANSTRNRFFAEGINSLAEVELDQLEKTPAMRLVDHLSSLGVFSPFKRYYSQKLATEGHLRGLIFAEPLAYDLRTGVSAYHDMRRLITWSRDNLMPEYWVANDFRIDVDTGEVAPSQSLISDDKTQRGKDTGPFPELINGRFTIVSGSSYSANLPMFWQYAVQDAAEKAQDPDNTVPIPLDRLIASTQQVDNGRLDELTCPVFVDTYTGQVNSTTP